MACGLTVIKRMPYRGNATEEFSNQYWFTGATPSSSADWLALFNALTAQEKTIYRADIVIVRGYGYSSTADDAVAVWSRDLTAPGNSTIAGTLSLTGYQSLPGDTAFWIRWKTDRLSVKGKPIYLRKYYHGANVATSTSQSTSDTLIAAQGTAAAAFAAKLWDGTFLDARTLTARGHTDTIVGASYSQYVTTRTLKRRGKRPGT